MNGRAEVVEDPEEMRAMIKALMAHHGEERGRRLGVWLEEPNAPADDLLLALRNTKLIRIQLKK